jgi:5-methylcytosine-specific restriction enzyme subunit McrC
MHAIRALEQGVLRGYVHLEERSTFIRGRIRFSDQIAAGGVPLPVAIEYDDYTTDILENRLLKTAATLLLRLPRVPAAARRRLMHLRLLLAEVDLLDRPREAVAPPITRLNECYLPAIALAEQLDLLRLLAGPLRPLRRNRSVGPGHLSRGQAGGVGSPIAW